jgi:hypothetical protein
MDKMKPADVPDVVCGVRYYIISLHPGPLSYTYRESRSLG